jgi:hypothetical protein
MKMRLTLTALRILDTVIGMILWNLWVFFMCLFVFFVVYGSYASRSLEELWYIKHEPAGPAKASTCVVLLLNYLYINVDIYVLALQCLCNS